jgi:hypothetical protein
LVLVTVGVCLFPTRQASASVIYEFRESGSSAVFATLEFASPPASGATAWNTSDAAALLSFSCECIYLGDLPSGADVTLSISSLNGTRLDGGALLVSYTIPPLLLGDPLVEGGVSVEFGPAAGADTLIGGGYIFVPDGSVLAFDSFTREGNWTIPEPMIGSLLGLGAIIVTKRARRQARRSRE